ncbi:TonB-dependent receptor [Sphingomonas bisphenolicum]
MADWSVRKTGVLLATKTAIALATLAASPVSGAALAQDMLYSAGTPDDIVVTARKRAEDLQQVPAAVTAITTAAIENKQLSSISDIVTTVPNLVFAQQYGVALVSIRGVAPDSPFTSIDPSVALHIDGVYQPRPGSMNLALTDLDSIEVLRGPQGTLYGRNATGGVINFRLRKPSDQFEASISGLYGNYDRRRLKGFFTGPVAEGVSVRASGLIEKRDGYGLNLTTGNRYDNENNRGGRLAVSLEPTSNLTVDVSGYYFLQRVRGPQIEALTGFDPNGRLRNVLPLPVTLEPHRVYSFLDPATRNENWGLTGNIVWDLTEQVTLTSITGLVKSNTRQLYDTVPATIPYSSNLTVNRSKYVSQELDLAIDLGSLGNIVAGLYYGRENNKAYVQTDALIGLIPPSAPLSLVYTLNQKSTTKAVFGDVTLNVAKGLRLLGGLRYNEDVKDVFQSAAFSCTAFDGRLKYDSLTGKLGAQYDVADRVMLYGQYQTGFKAGGYNQSVCGDDFQPEKINSYEGGVRARTSDGAFTINATGFSSEFTNLQVSAVVPINGIPSIRIENAAAAKIQGVEVETWIRPIRSVRVNLSATYLDAHYTDYVPVNSSAINPANRVPVNLEGQQITKAPKVTVSVGGEFDFSVAGATVTPRAELFFSSEVFHTPFHDAALTQSAYTIANAFLTITPEMGPLRLALYAKNFTDTNYITGGSVSGNVGNVRGFYNEPATYGGELTISF